MTESLSSRGDAENIGFAHGLCMLLTAISGPSDELERARLAATGLPSLLRRRLSGVALVDGSDSAWHLVLQQDGHQASAAETEQVVAEMVPLFEKALRGPNLVRTATGD